MIIVDYWSVVEEHPVNGPRWVRHCYTDGYISKEQADELLALYKLPSAPGSMPMSSSG